MAAFFSLLKRTYLSVYNWMLFAAWSLVLYLILKTLYESGHEYVYNAAEKPLQFAQTTALLEILHGLLGLVRSPVTATLPQMSSRMYLLWGILWSVPEIRTHILVTSLLLTWCVTEITRYAFFGMKEAFGFTPRWLLWLRYSTFLVLNITGVTTEIGLMYLALPFIKASGTYSIRMPNKLNFSFDYSYVSAVVMALHIPGFFNIYTHMLAQRKKALSKSKGE